MVYESCRMHAPIVKYSMSKLTDNREVLHFWTAVLAELSDRNSENFFLYKTQPHCAGLVRKVDLLPQTQTYTKFTHQKTGNHTKAKKNEKKVSVVMRFLVCLPVFWCVNSIDPEIPFSKYNPITKKDGKVFEKLQFMQFPFVSISICLVLVF